jgi:hypothetical protein
MAVSATPWSHRDTRVRLPAVTARLYTPDDDSPRDDLISALLDLWARSEDSNLLIVYGPLGAGKTSAVQAWIYSDAMSQSTSKEYSIEYLSLGSASTQELISAPLARKPFVVIDDFDTVSTAGKGAFLNPDLALIRPLFEAQKRVVVVTRRNPFQKIDEFTQQLSSPMRLSALLAHNPWLVRIRTFELESLVEQATATSDDRLKRVVALLTDTDERERELLLRPLLIDQLYELTRSNRKLPGSFTETYYQFIDYAMAVDYDRRSSRIPGGVRSHITRALAWDIFSGVESGLEWDSGPLEISFDRVAERVMEGIQSDPTLRLARDFDRYEWTHDFLASNHIFGLSDPSNAAQDIDKFFSFTHTSFYEYIAADGIWLRLSSGRPLDLDSSRVAEATFDSSIMSFVRAKLPGANMMPLQALARRGHLPWMDRLLLFYLLEDDPNLENVLNQAPDHYWVDLESHYTQTRSFFLKKAILYQLILIGKRECATYITLLKEEERDHDARLEAALLHVEGDHTRFLIARLRNPALQRARAVTVFRLGQLGDVRALSELSALGSSDPNLSAVCLEAISRIGGRLNA